MFQFNTQMLYVRFETWIFNNFCNIFMEDKERTWYEVLYFGFKFLYCKKSSFHLWNHKFDLGFYIHNDFLSFLELGSKCCQLFYTHRTKPHKFKLKYLYIDPQFIYF